MADAVIGLLIENLNSLIQRNFGLIWGVEQDISKLASLLSAIQSVLQDAEMRESSEKSIADWLTKLKDTAYDADDVLDEWLTYAPDDTCALACLSPNHITRCHRIAKKAKKIITRLDEIAGERSKLHLNSGVVQTDGNREMPIGMGQLNQLHTLSFFVVGTKKGRHITELKGLNHLGGEIEIKGLEHVRNVEEAKEANLLTNRTITSLALSSSGGGIGGANAELEEKVLGEGLEPHPNLKALKIRGFKVTVLPSWMGQLQNLVRVELEECNSCVCLPPLGKLPLLKVLIIWKMDSVKCIGDDFYGEGVVVGGRGGSAATTCWFPSLLQLEIRDMLNLEEWASPASSSSSSEENHGKRTQVFPFLKELTIWRCPKLKAIPCLPRVQKIKLEDCNEMILRSIPNFPPRSLLFLEIRCFHEMTHLPEGTFINSSSSTAALQSLVIRECDKLKSLSGEIQNLTALTSLQISWCRELDSLSELEGLLGKLTSLTHLRIDECSSLKCLPVIGIQGFNNSLTDLIIAFCENLTSVSKGLQYLTSLQKLFISDCKKLEFTSRDDQKEDGFQHLISLQSLTLRDLPKLRALPEGMQHLTSLQSLGIWKCHPDLHKRCERDKGENWHLISRIPQLRFFPPPLYEVLHARFQSSVESIKSLFQKRR